MWRITITCLLVFLMSSSESQIYFPNEGMDLPNFGRCVTPNHERALCLILEDCPYLYNILVTSPLLETDKLYLSRSQCGYRNGKVLICCPDRYRRAENTSTSNEPAAKAELLPKPGECGNVLSNRIFGGNVTKIDEFPWMALIEYTKPGGIKAHHCGGTLINNRYVLTASHCVNGKGLPLDWRLSGVRLGEWDTTTNPDCEVDVRGEKDCAPEHMDVDIDEVIPHPMYNPNSKNQLNDIALVRLKRSVEYTDFVRPICLPLDDDLRVATFDGIVMDVAGWGRTEKTSSSSVKLKAAVSGYTLEKCKDVYSAQHIQLDESQLCAGGKEGVDSCRGDSGGPLISLDNSNRVRVHYILVGIVSFGPIPCGLQGWPGVYTRVGNYVDWIKNIIRP